MFKGKSVIITGGANGIGEGIALVFGKLGAIVSIADVNEQKGHRVVKKIEENGGRAIFFKTDVSKEEDIINLMRNVFDKFGKLDILINNAGISAFKPLLSLSTDEWDKVINTNLRSVFISSREAAKVMKNGGRIINMASTRAIMSEPNSEAYAASKGGIVSITHSLAASLQPNGITVNCISPGWIQVDQNEELKESDHLQHWSNRVGKPEDIAKACIYLANPENNFINGQNIIIDGGMTRKMIYEE
ncbi:3-ketoacyl-ACP reductase [Bacillus sp. AFS077874]|uniref:SDR family NAD(P)-dependent oxidoreductase n=1 Tax=unclassified Bacillus (in: firmicutes) TaxID=185979 RepID=UPI000BECDBC1|nr:MULTISPECIES: glucose 1-dehydrogenase [unclassified Bacillus (in: firmicutes)]PEC49207.1 3-ketoacyl-ACP reductase [Bacillus sp. AFS096315]PFM76746.1 3-ketoacyl-ACP reductase [Bacillus sp. AFS077874]